MGKRLLVAGLIASLVANAVLVVIAMNHVEFLNDLSDRLDANEEAVTQAQTAARQAGVGVAAVEAQLPDDPNAPLEAMKTKFRTLRSDVNFIDGQMGRLLAFLYGGGPVGGAAVVEAEDVKMPLFCSWGDVAVWDLGGLSC